MRRLHGGQGGIDVAIALGDVGTKKGLGVVLDLLGHGFVGLAELEDHVGRTGVGAGRHGGDIGGFKQEETRRCGAGACGSNVNDDGYARTEDGARHGPHGLDQAAWGVEHDEHGGRTFGVGTSDGAIELRGGHGLDGVGENHLFDHRRLGVGEIVEEPASGDQQK